MTPQRKLMGIRCILLFWLFYVIGGSLGFLYLAWEAILILPRSFTLVQVLLQGGKKEMLTDLSLCILTLSVFSLSANN